MSSDFNILLHALAVTILACEEQFLHAVHTPGGTSSEVHALALGVAGKTLRHITAHLLI